MNKSRFKNYGLWLSILSLVPLILKSFGIDVLPENYNEICSSILGILVLAGILSSPTQGNGYLDTKPETTNQEENIQN